MRVLLDCRMAEWTGVGRYTVGITRALAARSDVSIVAAVTSSGKRLFGESPVETVTAEASPLAPAGMVQLSSAIRRVKPDLTHCLHFPTPWPLAGPLVVTLHDLTPLAVDGVMPSALRRAVYLRLNRRAARVACGVITPSAFTASDVERLLPAARGKTRVTGEGADDFSSGQKESLPEPLSSLAASPYVLSMGSVRPHKDLPTLLRAFSKLAEEHVDLRLLLVGEGVPGYLEAAGVSSEVRSRVAFTGRVSDGQLRTLYAGAQVFAFPSLYEGFGLPPLEAMALGAPVICSDAASLPEVVGDAALTFPAGDDAALASGVSTLLRDVELRQRLVLEGRERASLLTWATAAAHTVDVYRSVLHDR